MTPQELKAEYALAARPYVESPGPTPESALSLKSWRYVLEISSMCNLKCVLCHAGNRSGYEYQPGIMDMDLMEKILDKVKSENPQAVVCCYVNSEPFLHPRLSECVASIKRRGFRCEIATNFNFCNGLEQVLAANPDILTVSVSGFTQATYEKSHRGGNVEVVKENIRKLAAVKDRFPNIFFGVSYHMYEYNLGDEEIGAMRRFTESLGLLFMLSWGRAICIENTVQALRQLEGRDVPYGIAKNGLDLNTILPPAKPEFIEAMKNLRVHPAKARGLYERWPVSKVCIIADVFTEIRWDGRVQLCAWTDDMRLTLGNYLDMTQAQISEARRGHPLCAECLRYRLPLYFHIVDCTKWDGGGQP